VHSPIPFFFLSSVSVFAWHSDMDQRPLEAKHDGGVLSGCSIEGVVELAGSAYDRFHHLRWSKEDRAFFRRVGFYGGQDGNGDPEALVDGQFGVAVR
jgi:hypothetical protein